MARRARTFFASLVVLAFAAVPSLGGAAGQTYPMVCHASGPANTFVFEGKMIWQATLAGGCESLGDWYTVSSVVQGTSDLCGAVLLKNLVLNAQTTYSPVFFSTIDGHGPVTRNETWQLQNTGSKGLTPFWVKEGGKTVGAGNVGLRLTGRCDGKTWLTFRWVRTSPFTIDTRPISCAGSGTVGIGPSYYFSTYGWSFTGSAVCSRDAQVWDVTFQGNAQSDSLGTCGDPATLPAGGWKENGIDVASTWTDRATGQAGYVQLWWRHVDRYPTPYVIPIVDGLISTDPADGCWTAGSVRDATYEWRVVPSGYLG